MYPRVGVAEVVISCFVGLIGLGVPAAMLIFLYIIYNKVKSIEDLLKKE